VVDRSTSDVTKEGTREGQVERRKFLAGLAVAAVLSSACGPGGVGTASPEPQRTAVSTPVPTPTPTLTPVTLKIGYLSAPGIDGQLQVAIAQGFFAKQGITVEPLRFDAGPVMAQSLIGGSLDIAIIGGALPVFACQGGLTPVLLNGIEKFGSEIHVRPGINTVKDLKGKKLATARGTTSHMLVLIALEAEGLTERDIEFVNTDIRSATTSFIAGQVDAVAAGPDSRVLIGQQRPEAKRLVSTGDYYPKGTTMGAWTVTPDYAQKNKGVLQRVALAWLDANKVLAADPTADALYKQAYTRLSRADFDTLLKLVIFPPNDTWKTYLDDGTAEKIQNLLVDGFKKVGAIPTCPDASQWLGTWKTTFRDAFAVWKP